MPPSEKEEMLLELGVKHFILLNLIRNSLLFHQNNLLPNYLIDLGVVHAVAGFDFSYGYRGTGNMDRLKRIPADLLKSRR